MSITFKSLKKNILTFTIAGTILFSPVLANAELGDQTLSPGMKHSDIDVLHDSLESLAFLEKDDHYGSVYTELTKEAVLEFQTAYGLEANGKFDKDTHEVLEIALNEQLGETVVSSYTKTLKKGSKGKDVKALQDGLKKLGFLNIKKTTETFNDKTEDAVKDFQATYKLDVDGVAGRDTFNLLGNILKGKVKKEKPKTASRGGSIASDKGRKIIASAVTHKGKPYVFGASSGKAFDCSGYTQYVYRQNGISIPRTTTSQATAGKKVSKKDLQVGDLVIFSNTYRRGPSHAGIYMGNNEFIHASSGGKGVIVSNLNSSYYKSKFSYGRRVF